ncbi:MAG TPA: hypothetical protein PLI12_00670 [Acetobacteraceae bacterium]|nr:hypothetical protein [Acetobacteraceae bacterium]
MAVGDQADMVGRLQRLLPQGWFPTDLTTAPVLNAVLNGFAAGLAQSYALIAFALTAVLNTTAQNIWLDIKAQDFLGNSVLRRTQERDASFRVRMQAAIFPPGATRAALIARITALTGIAPSVFEPTQPGDTGVYGGNPLASPGYYTLGYSVSGGYGSLMLPFQAFVTVKRPVSQGVPLLAGYSGNDLSPVYAPLGYGAGLGSYVDLAQAFDGVTDNDIYQTVAEIEPAGSIIWTRITS